MQANQYGYLLQGIAEVRTVSQRVTRLISHKLVTERRSFNPGDLSRLHHFRSDADAFIAGAYAASSAIAEVYGIDCYDKMVTAIVWAIPHSEYDLLVSLENAVTYWEMQR